MKKAQLKSMIKNVYQEARETEIQVHRGGITNTEGIKTALQGVSKLATILNEIVDTLEDKE